MDTDHSGLLARLKTLLPHEVHVGGRRDLPAVITQVDAEVKRRMDADTSGWPSIYLVIHHIQRARDLRPEDDLLGFSSSGLLSGDDALSEPAPPSPAKLFPNILREGPDVGVHTIVTCDMLPNLLRTLDHRSLREFDMRVVFQMAAQDSSTLIDTPAASTLGHNRAVFYSEEQGRLEKFRPYGVPRESWLAWAGAGLTNRAGQHLLGGARPEAPAGV